MFKRARHFIKNFSSGYYNVLLLFLVLLFIFRPYERSDYYLAIWKFFLTGTLLSAIFNCNHNHKIKILTSILAVPTVIFSWLNLNQPTEWLFVANTACTIAFMGISTTSILFDVVLRAQVTLETLRGVICAYFMVAFAFAYVYYLIEYLSPGSFYFSYRQVSIFSYTHFISEMLYFSFVTLLTIGYGDITAFKDVAQTAAVIEGIIGQFYVAILVARLVSVYSFYSDKKMIKLIKKDISYHKKN